MIIVFIILILLFFFHSRINFKGLNPDYLNKSNTTIINGVFVVLVFISHFLSYNNPTHIIDTSYKIIGGYLGQLVVATFLFYSGYGIFEKIKNNQEKYMGSFLKKRFLPAYLNFVIAIIFFLILSLIIKEHYSLKTYLLSFIGYLDIGNSNWYMFIIFVTYLLLILCFKFINTNQKNSLIIFTLTSLLTLYIINIFKEGYWVDTMLCFTGGMWYSFYKDRIDSFIIKNNNYYPVVFISFMTFLVLFYQYRYFGYNVLIHNLLAINFVFIINLMLMKITPTNKIIYYLGSNVFWIYILQRIPMIIFQGRLNIYLYFILSLSITLILAWIMKKLDISKLIQKTL